MKLVRDEEALRRADADARHRAQSEFEGVMVLEAGAGTGKTSVLVARVLSWCVGPGWARAESRLSERDATPRPERIAARVLGGVVALTFTEAAAAEMETRIAAGFLALAEERAPVGLDVERLSPIDSLRERARALHTALEHLVVSTIHAYCRRLLAAHPLEAGVHPQLEIDGTGRIRLEVVREVLATRLRAAYAARGDAGLRTLAARGVGPRELEEALHALLEAGLRGDSLAGDPLAAERIASLASDVHDAFEGFRAAGGEDLSSLGARSRAASVAGASAETRAVLEEGAPRDRSELEGLVSWVRERWSVADLERLRAFANGRLTRGEASSISDRDALARASGVLAQQLRHLVALDVERLALGVAALRPLLAEVEARLAARGLIGFSELLSRARDLLVSQPEVACRVRQRIDQLLVDEFQDTDPHQCDIVRVLALQGESPPGCFLVGDPKQSIYGWREADLAAYDGIVEEVCAQGGVRRVLYVNHRSRSEILTEVERVIAPVMHRRRGIQPRFEPLVAGRVVEALPEGGGEPAVEYWLSVGWDAERQEQRNLRAGEAASLEARALALDLRRLHDEQGVAWSDIGVLFRARGDWDVYLSALRAAGVPTVAEGDRVPRRRREIADAVALACCVLDPHDRLALLASLRSPVVGVPDAALLPLWRAGLPERVAALERPCPRALERIRHLVREVAESMPTGVPASARLQGWDASLVATLEQIANLRLAFESEPADRWVERLRRSLLLEPMEAARGLGAWRVAHLERFFQELARELGAGAGARGVLPRLRRLAAEGPLGEEEPALDPAADPNDPGVQVRTLHGAKGLDFAHVYLMQVHKGSRAAQALPGSVASRGRAVRLLGAPTLDWVRFSDARDRVAEAERVRTLYVGMTRAAKRLVIAGAWPSFGASASSHAALLVARREGVPDLVEQLAALARAGASDRIDALGARWVFPALADATKPLAPVRVSTRDVAAPSRVRADARRLRRLRARAASRMRRPFASSASEEAQRGDFAARAARESDTASGAEPLAARAVGTVLHRMLEEFDLEADTASEVARHRAALRRALELRLPADALPAALARARGIVDRLAQGPLLQRLCALRARIVARELPLLVAPEGDAGPLGYVSGAADLIYRDPDDGELVIVDYKTDRFETASDRARRTRRHARQCAPYQRALRAALGLAYTPRIELWYLAEGHVERLRGAAGAGAAAPTAG